MIADPNGRIRLSWAQIVWGITTLAALIGGWYDTRSQLGLIRAELGLRVQQADKEHAQMWEAIKDAKASPVPVERNRR